MTGTFIDIPSHDGKTFKAYHATPANPNGGCIVVIQEIFGINYFMREVCDKYAAEGFHAVAPDLFWRQEPGVDITDRSQPEWDKAFTLYKGFDVELGLSDIERTVAVARTLPGVKHVGATGYCLGGFLTYMSACRSYGDAFAGYYGVGIETQLEAAKGLTKPAIFHIAEEDGFCDKAAQQKIKDTLGKLSNVTLYSYAGADHAFARTHSEKNIPEAASLANARTLSFFKDHLK